MIEFLLEEPRATLLALFAIVSIVFGAVYRFIIWSPPISMLPSASLSYDGKPGLYEPVHGSAPDIAGKGFANPCAAILSLEMALRWSLGRAEAADRLFAAVGKALDAGARTRDLGGTMSTTEMGDAVIAAL